jgi:Fe-S-cluster containining protein
MNLSIRLKILDRLYALYDEIVGSLDVACQKYCAHCCTRNVTLTTLEGYRIVDYVEFCHISTWLQAVKSASCKKRFQPKITTNTIAEFCMHGRCLPDEEVPLRWEPCPLLSEDKCSIYKVRPFGCRCMISKRNCHKTGFAEVDEFAVTVNTVFLQTIEDLDSDGCSGNLTDILLCLAAEKNRYAYRTKTLPFTKWELITNHPMKVLMIPPEHRKEIEPILQALRRITL